LCHVEEGDNILRIGDLILIKLYACIQSTFGRAIKINKKAHLNNIYIAITLSEKYSIVRITDDAKRAL